MRILNLGCGKDILPGATNVDIIDFPGVDIVCDLSDMPWDLGTDYDEIIAHDIIEHIAPIRSRIYIEFVEECWRLLKPGGTVEIRTCGLNDSLSRDPSHFKSFHKDSMDYFVPGTFWHDKYEYSKCKFEKVYAEAEGENVRFILRKI